MIMRLITAALAAAFIAGIAVAVLEETVTTPLILAAEQYEDAGPAAQPAPGHAHGAVAAHDSAAAGHQYESDAWAPEDGLERTLFSTATTAGTTFGFGLILLGVMVLAGARIDARSGLLWGVAAFVASGLAPGLGLAPELPGAAAADLAARQIWWAGTVIATAAGLFLTFRVSSIPAIAIGLALIALPHLVGAPHPEAYASAVPSELSGQFAVASLAVHAIAWCLTGAVAGFTWSRLAAREEATAFA